jgi:multisubunit Na+/H+ antiporter MnhB subunit
MQIDLYLTVLLVLMLLGAIVAVETRDLLSAVISVGVVGFGTSVGFLILGAPDLAITQVVVEIIVLVILIRGTLVRDEAVVPRRGDSFAVISGLVAVGMMLIACTAVYAQKRSGRGLPPFGNPVALRPYAAPKEDAKGEERGVSRMYLDESWRALRAAENAKDNAANRNKKGYEPKKPDEFRPKGRLHLRNRVTAVILDYRGYDTLGEATVILTAVVGALVILRSRGKRAGGRS